jgi:hypothetical protein
MSNTKIASIVEDERFPNLTIDIEVTERGSIVLSRHGVPPLTIPAELGEEVGRQIAHAAQLSPEIVQAHRDGKRLATLAAQASQDRIAAIMRGTK